MAAPIQQQQAMSLDQDDHNLGEPRKQDEAPEGEPLAKRLKPLEEEKKRDTPKYLWHQMPDGCFPIFDWNKGVMKRFATGTFVLTTEEMVSTHSETVFKPFNLSDGSQCAVKFFRTDGDLRMRVYETTQAKWLIRTVYDAYCWHKMRQHEFFRFAAKSDNGDYSVLVHVRRYGQDQIRLPSLTADWRFHCLMHDMSKYAKPVRMTAGADKSLAVALFARDVEYNAPSLAQMMRRNIDNSVSDLVDLHLGDDVSVNAVHVFLRCISTGDATSLRKCDDTTILAQVMHLARTWMVDDKPTTISSHTPLYSWMLRELFQEVRGEAGNAVVRRLAILSIIVEASKDELLPKMFNRIANGLNASLDEM